MRLTRELTRDGHIRRLTVTQERTGWVVREEEDSVVVQRVQRDDWHRVEFDVLLFDERARLLLRSGWTEQSNAA